MTYQLSLHQIAKDGDVKLVESLVGGMTYEVRVKKLSKRDKDKYTPLHYAVRYNHPDMCRFLLGFGAKINAIGEDDTTPLHTAAKIKPKQKADFGTAEAEKLEEESEQSRNIEVIHTLIEGGADLNQKDLYGFSALHHACLRGNTAAVELLLSCTSTDKEGQSIDAEIVDQQHMTPLHIAINYRHEDIVRVLLECNCSIQCMDDNQQTAMHLASKEGNVNILNLILQKANMLPLNLLKSALLRKDISNNTPLHLCVESGHLEVCKLLLMKYREIDILACINETRNHEETPLHVAASEGHLEIVKLLISNGASINLKDTDLTTPLIVASKFNHTQIVDYLLECGASKELLDIDGYSALLIAANYGHTETIQTLLDKGARIKAVDKNERSVLHQCAMENRSNALQTLLTNTKTLQVINNPDRFGNTPLHMSAMSGNIEILRVLLDNDCIKDLKNEDEQTPLHLASINGRVDVLRELVSRDKTLINDTDDEFNTALHLAALAGRETCLKELVDLGANISARNTKQWTPLDCSASVGHSKCATVLLEADSPVDPKDKNRITPLHLACMEGHLNMVKVLLDWKADVSLRAVDGRNALDFAIDHRQESCAMALVQSNQWQNALRNITKDPLTELLTLTPTRKLIKKMPNVALEVLGRCSVDNKKHPDHKEYKITFNYEFLDDDYICESWQETSDNVSEVTEFEQLEKQISGSSKKTTYTDDSTILQKNNLLHLMEKYGRTSLLKHPLVLNLLQHKWTSYGRILYYSNLSLYLIFMIFLNIYMLFVPPPFAADNATTTDSCFVIRSEAVDDWNHVIEGGCATGHLSIKRTSMYIILVMASVNIIKEILQLIRQNVNYLYTLTNYVEVVLYTLSIMVVIDVNDAGRNTGIRESWQWQCGAVAVFLSWIVLVLFVQNLRLFGIYVIMFTQILTTFSSLVSIFMLFLCAFSFSFHVLLQNRFAFEHWWDSLIKTGVMMIGEFEYDSLFDDESSSTEYAVTVHYDGITYTLFIAFVILMSIIAMNLLIGLAVDDIKGVQERAELVRLGIQVRLALDVEYTMPSWLRRRFLVRSIQFYPNKLRYEKRLIRWFLQDRNLKFDKVQDALNPESTEMEILQKKIDTVEHNVSKLRNKFRDLSVKTNSMQAMLKAVVTHLNVPYETNDDEDENA